MLVSDGKSVVTFRANDLDPALSVRAWHQQSSLNMKDDQKLTDNRFYFNLVLDERENRALAISFF